jgi:hypothetical protein
LWYESDTGNLYVYYGSVWIEVGHATDGGTALADADGDTMIQVEEGTDDDTIRFDTAGVERMVVKSDGKIGIGTTTPTETLHVYRSDGNYEAAKIETNTVGALLRTTDSTASTEFGTQSGKAVIRTANTPRLTIDATGKVGIGTTTPTQTLDVNGIASASTFIVKSGTGTYAAGALGYTDSNWGLLYRPPHAGATAAHLFESFAGADLVAIKEDGKVGIGITTPQAALSFANSTGNKIDFYHTTTGSGDRYGIQVQANELRIHAGAGGVSTGGITFGSSTTGTFTERMRITNAGKVGIGTTSPDYDLHIHNSATYGRIKVSGSSTGYTQADILLECSGGNRGAGIYMFNSYHDKTWYAGMPYTSTDRYILGRTSNAAMQQSTAAVGSGLFQFYSNGAAYNTTGTWGSTSDIRMKGEVETARSYLADLNQLRVVTYRFTKDQHIDEDTGLEFLDREEPSEKMLGLIAQEVEEIFPALVTDGTDEAMVLKQSVLVPMLLTAVQELSARIETLETA